MGRYKKKIIDRLKVEKVAAEGKCIAYHEGAVVFIDGAAPGDVIRGLVTKKKKNYLEVRPIEYLEHSEIKQDAFCQHFGLCGGCKWQHLPYSYQLQFKQDQVADALDRIAKVQYPQIKPILGSENTTFYRNKLEYTFSTHKWISREEVEKGEDIDRNALGFHIPGRHDRIVDIEKCYLQDEPSNGIRLAVRQFAKENEIPFYDNSNHSGFLRNLIIRNTSTSQWMVILQVAQDNKEWTIGVLEHLKSNFPDITSLQYVVNNKGNETFHDLDVICYHGQAYIEEEMEGLKFRIGPKSFYQTNSQQAYSLYKVTRELADLKGDEIVYDLYTGTGTIANFIAKSAKKVIGIEYVPEAIEDAKINSQINSISNTTFFAGDMKDLLTDEFINQHGKADVIISDPPRAGMHADVVQTLLNTAAQKIVYVSCNPATQARDLALLDEKYKITAVQPVDMFPHTHHVENVVLLELRD